MNFKPKLVAFDLDGTLAESKQPIGYDMGELLGELLSHVPVAVLSGAGFSQIDTQFLPSLPDGTRLDRLYIFPTNAAQLYLYKDGKWLAQYDKSFSILEKARITQALKESLAEVGLEEEPERPQSWGERIDDREAQISFSPLGQHAPVDAKQEWHHAHNDLRVHLRDALMRRLPDFSIAMGGLTTIDITRKGITKAYGIRALIKLTGISVSEMLYVGDALDEGGNDSVVIETGVHTHEVFGPGETEALIKDIIANAHLATIA